MNRRHTILLVEDDPLELTVTNDLLRIDYRTRIATSGEAALRLAIQPPLPDLILLDLNMPGIDGYEVCRRLKLNPLLSDIPVVFLSAAVATDNVVRGFALGAVDFVSKPVVPPILLARVANHLHLREARVALMARNETLEVQVEQRTAALTQTKDIAITAIGALAETRDNDTGNHIYRTQAYVKLLVDGLTATDRGAQIEGAGGHDIWKLAPLHDIGKIGIPDSILLKPGSLTAAEFEVMKTHTQLGRNALLMAEIRLGVPRSFLRLAATIAGFHHERWNGKGYPEGLGGETIPLAARLMAVADVYDAITTQRVYKAAAGHDEAIDEIRQGRGQHFDPLVADCFIEREQEVQEIATRFRDAPMAAASLQEAEQ